MNPTLKRRLAAYGVDLLVLALVLCFALFVVCIHHHLNWDMLVEKMEWATIMFSLHAPVLIAPEFLIAWFLIYPLILFYSYSKVSATPGQYLMKLKEVDYETELKIGPFKALLRSFAFPFTLLLAHLPEIAAVFNFDRRTLIQWWIDTKTEYVKQPELEETRFMNNLFRRLGVLYGLLGLCALSYSLAKGQHVLFNFKVSHHGLIAEGDAKSRYDFLTMLNSPKPDYSSPESTFKIFWDAVDRKSSPAYFDAVSQRSLTIFVERFELDDEAPIIDGPSKIEWVRAEGDPNAGDLLVVYNATEDEQTGQQSKAMHMIREDGHWKVDLFPGVDP